MQIKRKNSWHLILSGMALLLVACVTKDLGIYEKNVAIPGHEWQSTYKPLYSFTIADTQSLYNLFIVVRHTDAYHFNNLWLNFTAIAPGDTAVTQQLNLKLGDNSRWLGNNMDDVIEHRIRVSRNPQKLKAGNYHFILQNAMREDPLQNMLNIGIRVEKLRE